MVSLVRVSRRVKLLSFSIHIFILHLALFTLRSRYFSTIGHTAVFSLRSPQPPLHTALPSSPTPSLSQQSYGRLTPSARRITRLFRPPPTTQPSSAGYHKSSSAFTRRYSQNPSWFLLLLLLICLSPEGPQRTRAIQTPATRAAFRVLSRPSSPRVPMPPMWMVRASQHHIQHNSPTDPAAPSETQPPGTPKILTDPAAGSPTAAMLRLISDLASRTQTSQSSSKTPS